jgi:hypothetical protein
MPYSTHILGSDKVKAVWKIVKKERRKVCTEVTTSIKINDNTGPQTRSTFFQYLTTIERMKNDTVTLTTEEAKKSSLLMQSLKPFKI